MDLCTYIYDMMHTDAKIEKSERKREREKKTHFQQIWIAKKNSGLVSFIIPLFSWNIKVSP